MATVDDDIVEPYWLWPRWIARGSLTLLYGQDPTVLTSMVLMLANSADWGENAHGIPLHKPAEREEQVAIVVSQVDRHLASQALANSLLGASRSLALVDVSNFGLTPRAKLKLDLEQMLDTYTLSGFFPTLLAFDPWHRFLPGGRMTPRAMARRLVPPLLALARRYDCALLFTHQLADAQTFEAISEFAETIVAVQRHDSTNMYMVVRDRSRFSSESDVERFEFSP